MAKRHRRKRRRQADGFNVAGLGPVWRTLLGSKDDDHSKREAINEAVLLTTCMVAGSAALLAWYHLGFAWALLSFPVVAVLMVIVCCHFRFLR